jgi:hypothetical protein
VATAAYAEDAKAVLADELQYLRAECIRRGMPASIVAAHEREIAQAVKRLGAIKNLGGRA